MMSAVPAGPAEAPVGDLLPPMGVPFRVTPRVTWLLAPNPGPMTFDGTNTWLLVEPRSERAVLVDPGPDDAGHIDRIVALAEHRRCTISQILLTHTHPDHTAGVASLVARTGARVRAVDAAHADETIADGDVIEVEGLRIEVVATPGHSSDSVSFYLPAERSMLTGDTVLGRGAPAILHPDGRVGDMIASLRRLRFLLAGHGAQILPGHGPLVRQPLELLDFALDARRIRLEQIGKALAAGQTAEQIVQQLYAQVDSRIRFAAEANIRAHLHYLETVEAKTDELEGA